MNEDEEVFVTAGEFATQGPIIWETEGEDTGLAAAERRAADFRKRGAIRTAIFRVEHYSGNALLIHDLKRMQI